MIGHYRHSKHFKVSSLTPTSWNDKCVISSLTDLPDLLFQTSENNKNALAVETQKKQNKTTTQNRSGDWNNTSNATAGRENTSDVADILAIRWTFIWEEQPEAVSGSLSNSTAKTYRQRWTLLRGGCIRLACGEPSLRQDKDNYWGFIGAGSWKRVPVLTLTTLQSGIV